MNHRLRKPNPPFALDRTRRCLLGSLIVGIGLSLAACDGGGREAQTDGIEPVESVLNLATEAPFGDVLSEFDQLHFGTAEARALLGAGWSYDEISKQDGETSVWGLGEASSFVLPIIEPRDIALSLDGRGFLPPEGVGQTQQVTVSVGEHEIGHLSFGPRRTVETLQIPAQHLAVGRNTIRLGYSVSQAPASLGIKRDERLLAVAWYRAILGPPESAPPADGPPQPQTALQAEGDRLFVPSGTALTVFGSIPAEAELWIDDWQLRGDRKGRATLLVRCDGEEEARELIELRANDRSGSDQTAAGQSRLRLPLDSGQTKASFAEIVVRVAPGSGGSGLVLTAPRVVGPPATLTTAHVPADRPDAPSIEPGKANILLYAVDTLRADHLGSYGHDRAVSPRFDAWAREATVFEDAVAQSSWTKSSMASILTGLWPPAHGALRRPHALVDEIHTLPELLSAHGYRTAAFVTNPNVTETFGFDQGFETFEYLGEKIRADAVNSRAEGWLRERADESEPFFLWLHTLDPHAPYEPLPPEQLRLAPDVDRATLAESMAALNDLQAGRRPLTETLHRDLLDLYDAEIAANDKAFGALLDLLTELGLDQGTMIVFVSDHGEEFNEHGNWQHGRALHVESLHVPLVIRWPGQVEGRRIATPVEHLDLLPTMLAAAGLPVPDAYAGRNLRSLSGSEAGIAFAEDPIVSYLELDGPARISVRYRTWKSIHQIETGRLVRPRLFDLLSNPAETVNLADDRPVVLGLLAQIARRRLAGDPAQADREEVELDDELTEQLKALGYLQ